MTMTLNLKSYWDERPGGSWDGKSDYPPRTIRGVSASENDHDQIVKFSVETAGRTDNLVWAESSPECAAKVRSILESHIGRVLDEAGNTEVGC